MLTITCKNCTKAFHTPLKKQIYCSMVCRDISRAKVSTVELKCSRCGIIFNRKKHRVKNTKNYCSKKCSGPENHPKGIKWSEEAKIRMSLNAIDKNFGKWMKGKKGNKGTFKKGQFSKEKHPLWKGGITPINQVIRHSDNYSVWRKAVFERDDYTCQFCKKRGVKLEADHIKPFALFPELRFAIDNGRTLCKECHRQITKIQMKTMWKNQYS